MPWDTQPQEESQDSQMTADELQEMIATKSQEIAQSIVGEALEKQRIQAEFKQDVTSIESEYPEFNPDLEDVYDDSLAAYVKKTYPALRNAKTPDGRALYPGITLKRFVDDTMSLLHTRAEQAKSEATRNISRMEESQSVAPTATPGKKIMTLGDFKNMSLAEMEKVLPMAAE